MEVNSVGTTDNEEFEPETDVSSTVDDRETSSNSSTAEPIRRKHVIRSEPLLVRRVKLVQTAPVLLSAVETVDALGSSGGAAAATETAGSSLEHATSGSSYGNSNYISTGSICVSETSAMLAQDQVLLAEAALAPAAQTAAPPQPPTLKLPCVDSSDIRRRFVSMFANMLNNFDKDGFAALIAAHCVEDLVVISEHVGPNNPNGPNYIEIRGQPSVVSFWDAMFRAIPDGIFRFHSTKLKILASDYSCVVGGWTFEGTKMFTIQSLEEHVQQRVLLSSAPPPVSVSVYGGLEARGAAGGGGGGVDSVAAGGKTAGGGTASSEQQQAPQPHRVVATLLPLTVMTPASHTAGGGDHNGSNTVLAPIPPAPTHDCAGAKISHPVEILPSDPVYTDMVDLSKPASRIMHINRIGTLTFYVNPDLKIYQMSFIHSFKK
jgi:hypothetical protein